MSVLLDVLDKMMADFFSKEAVWNHIRDHGGSAPEPFTLTLDTPDFRQLKKGLQESRLTVGRDGILKYTTLRNLDDSLFQAEELPDEVLRTYTSLSVRYPYPANEHIYAARITHNYTGAPAQAVVPVSPPEWLSNPLADSFRRRLDAFRVENARLDRLSTPGEQRPGYRRGACNCIECRLEAVEQQRNRLAAQAQEMPDIQRTDNNESRSNITGLDQWTASPVQEARWWDEVTRGGIGQWVVGPIPAAPEPLPPAPAHPNDPRPRMPRLSDGRANNVESAAAIMRDIWNPNRVRF